MKKKLLSLLLSMVMLFSLLPVATISAGAATVTTADVTRIVENYWDVVTVNGTKSAYWNASKNEATLKSQANFGDYLSSITRSPCGNHSGGCTSNQFGGATQCIGFTAYMAYVTCGVSPSSSTGTYLYEVDSSFQFQPGDRVWYDRGAGSPTHSIFIYKVSGDRVYLIEANWGGNCHINKRDVTVSEMRGYVNKHGGAVGGDYVWRPKNVSNSDGSSTPTLTISPTAYPNGTCNLQNGYPLAGSITSGYTISSVKAEILDASGKVVMTSSQRVNTTNFIIRRSDMDMNLKFSELPNGTYKLRYTATDAKETKTWTSGSFTVTGSSAGGKTAEIEYFDCNVKLICQSGQVVNLYANPGDSSRVSYFSKGQTASSTYGAKLSDGSTWYRITVNDSSDGGKEKVMWLKVTSSVTVTDKHSHNYISSVTAPTCTAQGYTTHTCSCGESYKDSYTSALGHSYTSAVTKAATEKAEGVRTYTCSRCGHSYTESIPKQTHTNHNYISTITAPTCTAQGYTTHTCSCGESYKDSYTSALGHSYTSVITKTSTENAEGVRTYTCSRCGHSYTESTPKQIHTDHTYITAITAPTCTAQGYTTYTCTVCGDSYQDDFTPTVAHNYTVEITRTATASLAGLKTYTCTVCGAQYTEEYRADMPALPFNDVPNSAYYHSAVVWAYNNNVTLGTSATTFSPSSTCTRAQVVTFLWRAMGEPAPRTTKNSFADVQAGSYYYDAVLWAVEQGITTGTAATQFSPDDTCSNAHILTFLWRCMGKPMDNGSSLWYQDALSWASSSALLADTSAFANVDGDCPRSDVVTFLYRSVGY